MKIEYMPYIFVFYLGSLCLGEYGASLFGYYPLQDISEGFKILVTFGLASLSCAFHWLTENRKQATDD